MIANILIGVVIAGLFALAVRHALKKRHGCDCCDCGCGKACHCGKK